MNTEDEFRENVPNLHHFFILRDLEAPYADLLRYLSGNDSAIRLLWFALTHLKTTQRPPSRAPLFF